VSSPPAGRQRHPEEVVGRAVVVGLASAIPVALLVLLVPGFARGLAGGGDVAEAWSATAPTGEDWEMIPVFLLGALVLAAAIAIVAATVWLLASARLPARPRVAQLGAAAAAAAVPLLLLAWGSRWDQVLPPAVAAGLIALVAAPRLGHETRQVRMSRWVPSSRTSSTPR
jgi:hypothetical protein